MEIMQDGKRCHGFFLKAVAKWLEKMRKRGIGPGLALLDKNQFLISKRSKKIGF